ncbi:hypothetical protein A6K26_007840 [Gammaproteobacteria bacterium 2W06]|nr:hypothetical protein A6K26_007840 [Gammaproteobacteria bacterium 2W06]
MSRMMVMSEVNGRLYASGLPLLGDEDKSPIKAHPKGRYLPKALMRLHRDGGARQYVQHLFVDVGVRPSIKRPRVPTNTAPAPLELTPPNVPASLPPESGVLTELSVRSHDERRGLRVLRLADGFHCLEITPAVHPTHGVTVRCAAGRLGVSKGTGVTATLDATSLLAVTAVLLGERSGYDGGRDIDGASNTFSVMRHADGRVIVRLVPRGGHVVSLSVPSPDVSVLADRFKERVRRRYPEARGESVQAFIARRLPAQLPGDLRAV